MTKQDLNQPIWGTLQEYEYLCGKRISKEVAIKPSDYGLYGIMEFFNPDGSFYHSVIFLTEAGYMVVGRIEKDMVYSYWITNRNNGEEYSAKYYYPNYTFDDFVSFIITRIERCMVDRANFLLSDKNE